MQELLSTDVESAKLLTVQELELVNAILGDGPSWSKAEMLQPN